MNDRPRSLYPSLKSIAIVFLGTFFVGGILSHPYAGSWNDGSRLASVESVAERNTWVMDDSMFVFPNGPKPGIPNPYDPRSEVLAKRGTLDLMQIDGKFYSDKSPLPTLVMASLWKVFRYLGAAEAQLDPQLFCRTMNLLGGAFPLALGAVAVWILSLRFGGNFTQSIWIFLGGAVSGLPLAYSGFVNNHILVWAECAWLFVFLDGLSRSASYYPFADLVMAGCCLGMAYATDSGIGPALFVAVGIWMIWNPLSFWQPGIWFQRGLGLAIGGAPFVLAHHALGFQIAGTLGPINANPSFFQWPGCPFTPESLTGGFKHPHVGKFLLYTGDMLFGKKGFLFHTGVGLLGVLVLLRMVSIPSKNIPNGMRIASGVAFAIGVLVYALGSNNQSGLCRSVRWFVPLGIPLWYLASFLVTEGGWKLRVYAISVVIGLWVGVWAACLGPWEGSVLQGYWVSVVLLASCAGWACFQNQKDLRNFDPIMGQTER
jgi:hypothetical protein